MAFPVLSASKIKTFLDCPNRFYYHYIEHIPSPSNVYAVMGTSFHRAIEEFYKSSSDPYRTYITTWDKECARQDVQPNADVYYTGFDLIDLYPFAEKSPVQSEVEFFLPYPDEENQICSLHGYIDHVYADGELRDLKTSKRKPSAKALSEDIQFITYHWAYTRLYGSPPTEINWYHARTGDFVAANVSDNLPILHTAIESVLAFIQNPAPVAKKPCFFCPYDQCKELCE